ncbi:hypothetical protein [Nocardioides pacificus]
MLRRDDTHSETVSLRALAALACVGLCVVATGCDLSDAEEAPSSSTPVSPSPTAAPSSGVTVLIAGPAASPIQSGDADVDVRIAAHEGGRLRTVESPDDDAAIGFSPYRPSGPYPRAVIVVTNAGDRDALNPGVASFTWGTDFVVDARSEGRPEDNGDNLVQRGLFSEETLYKAELDLGRPACVVQGSDGLVTVRSVAAVVPGVWYHMECHRDGAEVSVTSWPLADPDARSTRVGLGATGDLTPADSRVPLSIGGKVSSMGEIVQSATDQLNGAVSRPFLEIERP